MHCITVDTCLTINAYVRTELRREAKSTLNEYVKNKLLKNLLDFSNKFSRVLYAFLIAIH